MTQQDQSWVRGGAVQVRRVVCACVLLGLLPAAIITFNIRLNDKKPA